MQTLLWQLLWVLVRFVLGATGEMISTCIRLAAEANDLKHADGTAYTGTEKYQYVLDGMIHNFKLQEAFKDLWKSTTNVLIELAVAFLKSQKSK